LRSSDFRAEHSSPQAEREGLLPVIFPYRSRGNADGHRHQAWPFPPYFIIAPDIRRARRTKSVAFFSSIL